MHRLNRAEYANAIRDLLALDIDAAALLPPDDESSGFDNIADVLTRFAVADGAVSVGVLEHQPPGGRQPRDRARAPRSIASGRTCRRTSISKGCRPARAAASWSEHTFPLDGEYTIKLRLWRNTFDLMRGMEDPHDIEIAMDGERLRSSPRAAAKSSCKMAENPGDVRHGPGSASDGHGAGEGGHAHDLGDHRVEEPRRHATT